MAVTTVHLISEVEWLRTSQPLKPSNTLPLSSNVAAAENLKNHDQSHMFSKGVDLKKKDAIGR